MNILRENRLNTTDYTGGPIVYWMSRDQRAEDNWALSHAQRHALEKKVPLIVVFSLVPRYLDATTHHYTYLLNGLQEVEQKLKEHNIPFFLLFGDPTAVLPAFLRERGAGLLVADFNPLRQPRAWKNSLAALLPIPFIEVDAHNIVPVRIASPKMEYGAYTLRPKLRRLLPDFLDEYPPIVNHPFAAAPAPGAQWEHAAATIQCETLGNHPASAAGPTAARAALSEFLSYRLSAYGAQRNDPTLDGQSHLSAALHFGHLSAQRVALEVRRQADSASSAEFLEELIVRRELSDNFCFYNDRYDSFGGFPAWAQQSLTAHRSDARTHLYSLEQFERAETHDPLWNAAQREMVTTCRMHGYMRMYWAKKILEWTASPEEAITVAVYLNDTYELDGRDPNGYAGIAWSIGGVHDRAWFDRPVFGKIRYMNAAGCARKFDVQAYCSRFAAL